MADEENDVKQINDKDENVMDDSSKAEVMVDKKDTKEAAPEVKSGEKEETDTKEEKIEEKSEDDEDGDDDEGEDEDEDEEKETLPPGLLEQPLEVEGKRQKRKVERLSATMMRSPTERPQIEIGEGRGTKLGDIPYVTHYLTVTKAADLKSLHKLLFMRAGTIHEIKKNIKKFSGTTEAKDSKEREKRLAVAQKMSLTELKTICLWLGLRQAGTKSELTERTISFLEKPEDQGMEIKKKRSKSKPAKAKGTKRKRKTKKTDKEGKPKKKAKKSKDEESGKKEEEDEEDMSEGEEEEEEENEDTEGEKDADEDDSEDETPKKKKPKLEVKKKEKKTPKKTVKENGKKEKASPNKEKASSKKKSTPSKVKSPKKETKKKATPKEEELADSLSEDSDSEEEPLVKSVKPPSDDEIKKVVKGILDGADLETVTMKTVVKQVYAKYPKFDLSERKDFIKSTVREVIS
ncbi:hypothetical protein RRG08_053949 [Elysia crispata]|uniref:SAP domain-containing protein n=1 Tax=Elysia crispata TaxID=231223 RepID=A0AAE1DFB2_9GAST|nr:hypothetical protein RRG08_053949 [Elysia crispata]